MTSFSRKLILLVNLGSPDELSVIAIRKFLRIFLSDQRVVGLPKLLWYPILYGIILPIRAKKLLHKYQQIWHSSNMSPLVYYTREQSRLLQEKIANGYVVDYAFSYGNTSIDEVLTQDKYKHLEELIVLPLYPQFSSSTTASVFDQLANYYAGKYFIPEIRFINSFYDNPVYIRAIADKVRRHWELNGRAERLLVSFHSVPVALIEKGDSYLEECKLTYFLLCKELGINPEVDAKLSFQSKFGRAKWVEPATSNVVELFAKSQIKTVDVVCPGFMSDCLETLEEIAIMNKEHFIVNGGHDLRYISCLNDDPVVADILNELIRKE